MRGELKIRIVGVLIMGWLAELNLPCDGGGSTNPVFDEHYFDIDAGSLAGAVVTGMVQSKLNQWGGLSDHHFRLQDDAGGLFTLTNHWNADNQLFGLLAVSQGRVLNDPEVHSLQVHLLRRNSSAAAANRLPALPSVLGCMNFSIHAVAPGTKLMDQVHGPLEDFMWSEKRLWGDRTLTHQQVGIYMNEIRSDGSFPDLPFYSWSKAHKRSNRQQLGLQWQEAISRIGGLAHAYSRRTNDTSFCITDEILDSSSWYESSGSTGDDGSFVLTPEYPFLSVEPGDSSSSYYGGSDDGSVGNLVECVDTVELKETIYRAVIKVAAAVTIDMEDIGEIDNRSDHDRGDGFALLFGDEIDAHGPSAFVDALMLPGHLFAEDMYKSMAEPATNQRTMAMVARESFARLTSTLFVLSHLQRTVYTTPWGDISDARHTGGVWSDANQRNLMRCWVVLLTLWQDYNRPITYVPYWYSDYNFSKLLGHGQLSDTFSLRPDFFPQGVFHDVRALTKHAYFVVAKYDQSGFSTDGLIWHRQHGHTQIDMAGAGFHWLTAPLKVSKILSKTKFHLDAEWLWLPAKYLTEVYPRIMYKDAIDWAFAGSDILHSGWHDFAQNLKDAAALIIDSEHPNASATLLDGEVYETLASQSQLSRRQTGNFAFWTGNSMVHRRNESRHTEPYYMSLRMKSNQNREAGQVSKADSKRWHIESGMLQVLAKIHEFHPSLAIRDWHALPGVTEEYRNDDFPEYAPAEREAGTFAGLVSDGTFGMGAFQYAPPSCSSDAVSSCYSTVSAKKAYFFCEHEVVAVGNSIHRINSGQQRPIVTTVEQTMWHTDVTYDVDGDRSPVTVISRERIRNVSMLQYSNFSNGSDQSGLDAYGRNYTVHRIITIGADRVGWFHHGSIGYLIFGGNAGATVQLSCGILDAANSSARLFSDTINQTKTFLLLIDHGVHPGNGTYSYIVVPNMRAEDMPSYVVRRALNDFSGISIVQNDAKAIAVYDMLQQLTQIAYFDQSDVSLPSGLNISVSQPTLLQILETNRSWTVAAAEPSRSRTLGSLSVLIKADGIMDSGSYSVSLAGVDRKDAHDVTAVDTTFEMNCADTEDDDRTILDRFSVCTRVWFTRLHIGIPDQYDDENYAYKGEMYLGSPVMVQIPRPANATSSSEMVENAARGELEIQFSSALFAIGSAGSQSYEMLLENIVSEVATAAGISESRIVVDVNTTSYSSIEQSMTVTFDVLPCQIVCNDIQGPFAALATLNNNLGSVEVQGGSANSLYIEPRPRAPPPAPQSSSVGVDGSVETEQTLILIDAFSTPATRERLFEEGLVTGAIVIGIFLCSGGSALLFRYISRARGAKEPPSHSGTTGGERSLSGEHDVGTLFEEENISRPSPPRSRPQAASRVPSPKAHVFKLPALKVPKLNPPDKISVSSDGVLTHDKVKINDRGICLVTDDEMNVFLPLSPIDLKFLGTVGHGASGRVDRVQHTQSGQVLALKTVVLDMEEQSRQRIVSELLILHECQSPHVVGFYGAYYCQGSIAMALEYLDGGSLLQLRRAVPERRIPERILASMTVDLLSGLRYLHKEHHIIHRDIKPSNLLFNLRGHAKLADFGVSSKQNETLANAKTWVGTTTYMSPERITGQPYSFDSDVWSLGLSLMECAIGRYPYFDQDEETPNTSVNNPPTSSHMGFFELLHCITTKEPPSLPPGFSTDLQSLVAVCLSRIPNQRPTVISLHEHPFLDNRKAQERQVDTAQWLHENYDNMHSSITS